MRARLGEPGQHQIGRRGQIERRDRRKPSAPTITQPSAARASARPHAPGSAARPEDGGELGHHDRPSRMREASSMACAHLHAAIAQLVGELDHENTVLGHDPDQQHQADLRIDVERPARQHQRKDRAGQPERHRHHDDQRRNEALELRRQHQKDNHHREAERGQQPVGVLADGRRFAPAG